MRIQLLARVVAPVAVLMLVPLALPGFASASAAVATTTASVASSTTSVTYDGVTLNVPASWPVINLTADPTQCVRFDRSAVYLGHAGPTPQCPAHVVGQADAVQIEAADALLAARTARATAVSTVDGVTVKMDPAAAEGATRLLVPQVGTWITASRAPANSVIDAVLHSLKVAPGAAKPAAQAATTPPASVRPAVSAAGAAQGRGLTNYVGPGFDTCAAPSEATMNAWLASPYRGVGIYIGGVNEGCKSQANLSAQWVADETNQGWRLVPTYVGLQAPCNSGLGYGVITPGNATAQGGSDADDAVSGASSLGLLAGSPIYNDMEGFDTTVAGCSQAVLAYLNGWTAELHARGYLSGVYGSSASTVAALVSQYDAAGFHTPDDIWFADWNSNPSTTDSYIPSGDWSPHRRLHQYAGSHNETWGGATINVDSDYDDGALVGAIPGYVLDGWGGIHSFGGAPGLFSPSYWPGWNITRGLVLQPNRTGGYVLDGWGGVHAFGAAPAATDSSYWPGQDVARAIALDPCDSSGTSGYVLDSWGGVHPFGGAPYVQPSGYWPGIDTARALVMVCSGGQPIGQVMDSWGGLHAVGAAPMVSGEAYWPGQNLAVAAVLTGPASGYSLDSWGGIHPFGGAPAMTDSAYWPGTNTARGMALTSSLTGGYVLDAWGGIHSFGNAAPQNLAPLNAPLARGIVTAG